MIVFLSSAIIALITSILVATAADTYLVERIAVLGSFAGLQLSYNTGVAFGMELPEPWQSILIGGALLLLLFMAWHERGSRIRDIGFGLIIGGALGNIVDRFPDGRVTDFFQVGTFPIFNVADSCVTVGVILLLLDTVLHRSRSTV